MRKRAEGILRRILKHYNWFWHKYGDVRYCMYCKRALPKSENAPDFAAGLVYTWIEAKNSAADGAWRWVEIATDGERCNQRAWLKEHGGWLFIELGTGKAPRGKAAYLVPFNEWVSKIEPRLIEMGIASLRLEPTSRRPGADEFLSSYRLLWTNGAYEIPCRHPWWYYARDALKNQLETVEEHLS